MAIQTGRPLGFTINPPHENTSKTIWFKSSIYTDKPQSSGTPTAEICHLIGNANRIQCGVFKDRTVDLNGGTQTRILSAAGDAAGGYKEISADIESVLKRITSAGRSPDDSKKTAIDVAKILSKLPPSEQLDPIFSLIRNVVDSRDASMRGKAFSFLVKVVGYLIPRMDLSDHEHVLNQFTQAQISDPMHIGSALSVVTPQIKDPEARHKYTVSAFKLMMLEHEYTPHHVSSWLKKTLSILDSKTCWALSNEIIDFQKYIERTANEGQGQPYAYYTHDHLLIIEHLEPEQKRRLALNVLERPKQIYASWPPDTYSFRASITDCFHIFRNMLPAFNEVDQLKEFYRVLGYEELASKGMNRATLAELYGEERQFLEDLIKHMVGPEAFDIMVAVDDISASSMGVDEAHENRDRLVRDISSLNDFLNQNSHLDGVIANTITLPKRVHDQVRKNAMLWTLMRSANFLSRTEPSDDSNKKLLTALHSQIKTRYIDPLLRKGLIESNSKTTNPFAKETSFFEEALPLAQKPRESRWYLELKTWLSVAEEIISFKSRLDDETLDALRNRLLEMEAIFTKLEDTLPLHIKSQFEYVRLQIRRDTV